MRVGVGVVCERTLCKEEPDSGVRKKSWPFLVKGRRVRDGLRIALSTVQRLFAAGAGPLRRDFRSRREPALKSHFGREGIRVVGAGGSEGEASALGGSLWCGGDTAGLRP
jgi:hypothetical protein